MEKININSNINLYYIPMTKLKTTTIGVYIHRSLNKNDVSRNAILPYVLKRGCKLCPDSESVSKYLEGLYGARFSTYTAKLGDDQLIHLGFETISDKYGINREKLTGGIVKLMLSALFEPVAFTEEVLEQEKKNAKDRILAELNNKTTYAMHRCGEEMCEGDSFALSTQGTVEGIEGITADGLKAYYESIITSSPIDIYVCGECDINDVESTVKERTSVMNFKAAGLPQSNIFKGGENVKKITEPMDVAQGKLSMGFVTDTAPDSPDYPALVVMNSIFGGGAHSKLFNNVREKLSLCYYASASLVKNKGIIFVNAGIEFANFEKAYNEILAQLDSLKKGDISELEFTSSISALVNEFESYKDNQSMLQLYYLGQRISGTELTIDEMKEKINAVTVDDVVRAAKKVRLDTVYFLTGKEEA